MLICYEEKAMGARRLGVVDQANEILAEYDQQGFVLTLRQLYYQFVARGLLGNTQQNYKNLGDILNDARLAGLVSWDMMEDRTRNLVALPHWDSPAALLKAAAEQYRRDLWEDQPTRVEVWIEKDALVGVIEGVCRQNDVPYFACRGNTSQSEAWRAGRRFLEYAEAGQDTIVLHLGDLDPNGWDMSRDNQRRLSMFAEEHIELRRLALNIEQVRQYNPPPNPVKLTDSRAIGYIEKFGDTCWELDALEPRVISRLIQDAIDEIRDADVWRTSKRRQEDERQRLLDFVPTLEEPDGEDEE